MLEKLTNVKKILNVVCAVVMLAVIVLQFLPYWSYTVEKIDEKKSTATDIVKIVEEKESSIASFVWLQASDKDIAKWFSAETASQYVRETGINKLILAPVFMLVISVVGIVFCLKKSKANFVALLPAADGLIGVVGYLTQPVLKLGSLWTAQIAVSAVLAVLGIACVAIGFVCWAKRDKTEVKVRKKIQKLA